MRHDPAFGSSKSDNNGILLQMIDDRLIGVKEYLRLASAVERPLNVKISIVHGITSA
jgi:hypothetical protein